MNLVSEQALYRKINLLRFVAIVCVLIAHSENYEQFGFLSGTLAFQVEHDVLASCEWVVSSFFMLSAMLFFASVVCLSAFAVSAAAPASAVPAAPACARNVRRVAVEVMCRSLLAGTVLTTGVPACRKREIKSRIHHRGRI